MKKFFLRGIAAVVLLMTGAIGALAQNEAAQIPQLPKDPNVVTGQLDNGLTYYIRHNATPKGQADFYIAQKVGSILEEDNQRGLAHFLEHMCFNGTTHYPEKGIINWLESVGVKFGYNLNAYTGVDETVYNISNVPVARQSVQDSCLLILHDWACDLTLAPEEIDAERAVIHEEWRQSNVGAMRIYERLLPEIYPNNRYGHRLPIGTMEVVDNFPYQALIDYYHTWYRPDQQAVVVVGDIDPAYIEGKIKEMFSHIQMPANPKERVYLGVEDTPGTIYAIGADPEVTTGTTVLFFKSDEILVPRELRNTQMFYIMNYMQTIIEMMLSNRFDDLANKPECTFTGVHVGFGDFFLSKTKGALEMDVVAKGNNMVQAFSDAYRELLRAARGGFTIGEYERARQEYLSQIDRQYQERNSRQSEAYVKEYVREFIDGNPAPGIEVEKPMLEQFAQLLPVEQLNGYFASLITDDNRVLMGIMPERADFTVPTEEQFAEAIDNIDNEDLEPYKDEVRTDPLIPSLPAAGSVVSTRALPEYDATEYTLSNGVKVVVKSTDFKANQIIFAATALGNAGSTLDQALAPSIKYAEYALSSASLNNYSNSDLRKYMAGKQANVDFEFSNYTRDFEGSTTVADLPTLMELIYSWFTGFNLDESEYTALQGSVASALENQESNPQVQFSKHLLSVLFNNAAAQTLTADDVRAANRQTIIDLVRKMTANAADYTFYFVGDVNAETLVPLLEKYIATLPADVATATTTFTSNPDFEIRKGSERSVALGKMQTPQSWVFVGFSGKLPYTAKSKLLATTAGQILSKRLLNKVREEMGAVYSISANGSMSRINGTNVIFQSAFPMKPELRDEVLTVIHDIIYEMQNNISAEELNSAVEYIIKSAREQLEKNESWASAMSAEAINGVATFKSTEEVAKTLTTDDVKKFMKNLLKQGNYREIILDPETTPTAE